MRVSKRLLGLAAAGSILAAPASAGEAWSDSTTLITLLQQRVTTLLQQLKTATDEADAEAGTGILNLLGGTGGSSGDLAWAQSVALVTSLANVLSGGSGEMQTSAAGITCLGGTTGVQAQSGPSGYYAGVENVGGTTSSNASAAQAVLLRLLLAGNATLPENARGNLADQMISNNVDTLVNVASSAMLEQGALVGSGSRNTLMVASRYFPPTGAPVFYGPPGFRVVSVERLSSTRAAVTFDVAADACPGQTELRAFQPNASFLAADTFKVFVIAGSAQLAAVADDHPNGRSGAALLTDSASGEIAQADDEDVFRVEVGQPGQLTVTSSGGTDVVLALEDAAGNVVAADDDGGGWYNAKLSRQVLAGSYFVRVRHFSGGTGKYAIRREFAAN